MSQWETIYQAEIKKAGGEEKYVAQKAASYRPLLKRLIKYSFPHGRILEAGCGTAALSTHLSLRGFDVTALDRDDAMLGLARSLTVSGARTPNFITGDLFSLDFPKDYFNVSFSHGTLEHFPDHEIILAVNQQLAVAKTVIVSIPSSFYKEKDRMYGDERFLSKKEWIKILAQTRGRIIFALDYSFPNILNRLDNLIFDAPAPCVAFGLIKT